MELLEDLLQTYSKSNYYGFHMPGHKRNIKRFGKELPYGIDITEIEGFDDLHHPESILLEMQNKASELFKAEKTFYLINGSTVGNLAAVMSVTNRGDKILVARNNHKSVYNAVFLNGLKPIYIYPQYDEKNGINGEIRKEEIEEILLKEPEIKAVVIVSPTYDGVISDIKGISSMTHRYNIPLIVDEAHGAHLGMHSYFPQNSNVLGADIVVHSVHKTLPSLTQTGVLHVNGTLVDREKLQRYLKMLQSSSPSYVLMASIDSCINIVTDKGEQLFKEYVQMLETTRNKLSEMKHLRLIDCQNYDKSKIIISVKNTTLTSRELYNILLEKYYIQMEMCGADYVTAMTSIGDTKEGFLRLREALQEIDGSIESLQGESYSMMELPQLVGAPNMEEGSKWFYYLYPPGIPFIVPGEIITDEVKGLMERYKDMGFVIQKG